MLSERVERAWPFIRLLRSPGLAQFTLGSFKQMRPTFALDVFFQVQNDCFPFKFSKPVEEEGSAWEKSGPMKEEKFLAFLTSFRTSFSTTNRCLAAGEQRCHSQFEENHLENLETPLENRLLERSLV